jgi:hypothetical protein
MLTENLGDQDHHWGFSGSSCGDIADADDGTWE